MIFKEYGKDHIHPLFWGEDFFDPIFRYNKANPFTTIPPSDLFGKEMMSIEKPWMKNCNFILVHYNNIEDPYGVETHKVNSLDEIIELVNEEAKVIDKTIVPSLKNDTAILVGLDLETSSLQNRNRIVGGDQLAENDIVGVCVAVSTTKGYYIPVNHTEEDGVLNFPIEEVRKFLANFQNGNYLNIWHNALYDITTMASNKIALNKTRNHCTFLLWKMTFEEEYHEGGRFQYGLKPMSANKLGREMKEIGEIVRTSKKSEFVQFYKVSATSATIYGVSDAINTLALWHKLTDPKFNRNPYKEQPTAVMIETRAIYDSMFMMNTGIPIAINHAIPVLKTIIRRQVIIENKFKMIASEFKDLGFEATISSDEKVGILIGSVLTKGWDGDIVSGEWKMTTGEGGQPEILRKNNNPIIDENTVHDRDFAHFAKEQFNMEVKKTRLKSATTDKIMYSTKDEVLEALKKKLAHLKFVDDNDKELILSLLSMIQTYRSLDHERAGYVGIIRASQSDDRGYPFANNSLNISGTDTGRYSNAKTSLTRLQVNYGKTKTTVTHADKSVLPNMQGLSARPYILRNAKKLKKVPSVIEAMKLEIDNEVEERFKIQLTSV